ncbi:hypothetical protein VP1G_09254 [Cytospora mali]|uniref:RRM domain-containing protein n=1 Tax=Cytospora mali TaxID=578113 RepID=A0A194VDS1_CYTMA|nr:hypothetical protein VP1G_09254 [Valsa mali var. pyri (nom. inval.)]
MASTLSSNNSQGISESNPSVTAMTESPRRYHWTYVKGRNGIMMIEPVVGFYFNPPPGAKCRWSTDNGRHEPQHLRFGQQLPKRHLVLWNDAKLENEAAVYREKYWEDMKTLTAPKHFEDLYEYFDGLTIWLQGAANMWNLVNLLVADAQTNWQEHEKRIASECNTWILDWLESFPTSQFNRDKLIRWNQKTDIITAVTTQYDWMNDLRDLDMVGQNILRECFLFHYKRLTGENPVSACFNHRAADAPPEPAPASATAPAVTEDAVIDSTDVSPKSLPNGQPDFKVGTSPSQSLATIPEHASPTKASVKAQGLTIDTIASTKIPKHTVSAPATAVPHVTITPQASGEAEDILAQKNGSNSINKESFNRQALGEQFEVKTRQLSAQSAPEEKPEPILSALTDNDSQPRAASTTLELTGLENKDAPSRNTAFNKPLVVSSGIRPNYDMNQPSSRTALKSPPRGPRLRRQGVAPIPTYQVSQHPMVQQGTPMGPPPSLHQHMMPPFGPHNGMQQPPAGFGPPPQPHGMPPPLNGLPPQGPPPPGVGMPPMGPSGVPFQNQFPIPPSRTDMPPFKKPQGHPMTAPPQYTAQQNVGAPLYQPHGYIQQQPQHQSGHFNGNRQVSQNGRRNSVNSSGSRKLRDDPIHGPVYALNPRKNSNTSSGPRRSSNASSEQMFRRPSHGKCVNQRSYHNTDDLFTQTFDECPCQRCVEASRSVFVKNVDPELGEHKIRAILMRYLSAWDPRCVRPKSHNRSALVVFNTDHDAVSAIQSFWSAGEKKTIPGLCNTAFIWYPLYSRHYNPRPHKPTGAPRGLIEAQNTSRRLSGSSKQRRGSNPYLGQRPNFNNPNFGIYAPGLRQQQQQQMAGQLTFNNLQSGPMYAVPYQPQPPQTSQRTLWVPPPANETRRKSSTTESTKEEKASSSKSCSEEPAEEFLRKEDWRSKPPSEEAIEDSSDEIAVADTASNVSSQGARSIKVCLPSEGGSARSRSVSPEVEDSSMEGQAEQASPNVEAEPEEEPEKEHAPIMVEATATKANDEKSSSGYNKTTSELAVPVEEFQHIISPEQAQPTKEDDQKTAYRYSKVTSELTGSTEMIDINTVIRHKPQQKPRILPTEWQNEPDGGCSELQSRFAELQNEFQDDLQDNPAPELPAEKTEGASTATVTEVAPEEPAPREDEPQVKQPRKKSGKHKKKQAQTATNAPSSGPSSNTPTDGQSRGPSRASTGRPESRASTKHPQSAASTTAESSSRPSSAMQLHQDDQPKRKKNNKSHKKRKQTLTVESSAISEGQAKTGGSQDRGQGQNQGRAISGQESPKKKPKTVHPGPDPEPKPVEQHSAPEPATKAMADGSQAIIEKQQDTSIDSSYRANAGGSLRMKKNRSPTKSQQKGDEKEEDNNKTPTKHGSKPLQTIFEPPSEEDRTHASPDANLFPHQKFAIDQAKSSAPPKITLGIKKDNTKPSGNTNKFTTNNARIGSLPPGFNPYPQLPPNTKPSAWSTVVKRSISDDPFSSGNVGEDQSKTWMKDQTVRSPQKPRGADEPANTSPTPSPEKKSGHRGGKNKTHLNAAAKAFTPMSSPTMSVVSLRTTATAQTNATAVITSNSGAISTLVPRAAPGFGDGQPIANHAKKPSLPGQKGDVIDTRFVTPAEQTLDPAKTEQPGPPTKEKKRVNGPAQQQQKQPTAAQVAAAAAGNTPTVSSEEEFPTLAAAATAPKKQAAGTSTVPTSAPSASQKKESGKPALTSPGASATSPNTVRLGQRGVVSGTTPTPGAPAKKAEQEDPEQGDWKTIGPSKKTGVKNTTIGRAARSGAAGGRGGKLTQQGSRGVSGRGPVGEERKGG